MSEGQVSRRGFVKRGALSGAAAGIAPMFVPRHVLGWQGKPGANDRIRVGIIGVGNRGNLLIDQFPDNGQIVAVADCFLTRADEAVSKRKANWSTYQDYRRILERKDIDGVVVATNEHWHSLCATHACLAGKDVYVEKPVSLYVYEGRVLVRAARKMERVVQVGSQQRSIAMNRLACEFVRNGGLGKILFVQGLNYSSPSFLPRDLPEDPIPEGLSWDLWVGPAPMRPYNARLAGVARPVRGLWEFDGGNMAEWGTHGLDQMQSALGMDETGPVEFWLINDGISPPGALAFRYANGVAVRLEVPRGDIQGGGNFVGERGRIEIIRNMFRTDPPQMVKTLPPPAEVQKWRAEVALWQAKYHMQEWLDCMRTRARPSADVEIGHRTATVCHVANITRRLGRKLSWNPDAERFVGDEEANGLLTRPNRKGYELPVV